MLSVRILRVVEESDSRGNHQLLMLRNPWGRTEWKGDWSDYDTTNWSTRLRKKLDYFPTGDTDDGIFWMSLSDFVNNYKQVYVCRLFKTVEEGGNWHKYTVNSGACGDVQQSRSFVVDDVFEYLISVFVSCGLVHQSGKVTRLEGARETRKN